MPIDFPDAPNLGDTFTVNDKTWTWNGSTWELVATPAGKSGSVTTIADTAPSNPALGDEWFNSSTGRRYTYYDDYWIEVGASVSGQDATLTRTVRNENTSTALVSGDANQVIRFTGGSSQVLTIDDVLEVGDRVEVVQDNSGQIEFRSGSGVTLLSDSGEFGSSGQNTKVEVMCVASGEYRLFGDLIPVAAIEYLVIAGGGGGGIQGGAGAGGYRSSVQGELSGGGASAESVFTFGLASNYTVTIGAGGAPDSKGQSSSFDSIVSNGGSHFNQETVYGSGVGAGNGGANPGTGQVGTVGQGSAGGNSTNTDGAFRTAGGGGGAGSAGLNGGNGNGVAGDGGAGIASSITGSSIFRGGGGGGHSFHASDPSLVSGGDGGNGGGGQGEYVSPSQTAAFRSAGNGVANTGGGGGSVVAGQSPAEDAGSGGSGVVILRYPSFYSINIGAGLTGSENTDGNFKYAEITAGTGNVSFSEA